MKPINPILHSIALLLAISIVTDAQAGGPTGRKPLRTDLGADWWSETSCSVSGVQRAGETVLWSDHRFDALNCMAIDFAFCEETVPGFFSDLSFPEDEASLAQLVGPNTDDAVSGARWTITSIGPWDAIDLGYGGYQWAFYFFPDGITIVALYGLQDQNLEDLPEGNVSIEDPLGLTVYDNLDFQGEYFCFRNGEFTGTWDGAPSGSDPSNACPAPPP